MDLLLGIDLGTSYFKVGLFDRDGTLHGLGRVAVPKTSAAPGRSELAVADFWSALRQGLNEALTQAKATAEQIVGLSYSSQATTFLLLDRAMQPLTPLIMWIDERGAPVTTEDAAFAESESFRRTIGYAGISGQSAPAKWRWFQRNAPDVWARVAHVLTISDYFTFAFTGELAGDASTAAFLGVCDLTGMKWWPEALAFFGVQAGQFVRPLRPGNPCGSTSFMARERLGLRAGIPFAVGALDHHAAAIGSGLGKLAEVSISTGTVLAALVLVNEMVPRAGCYHGAHADGKRFWRLSFDPAGAVQLEDYRTAHAPDKTIPELLGEAERPEVSADGRAVREIMERVCRTQRTLVEHVRGDAPVDAVLATGGGARSPLWLQITADVLRARVVTASSPERACLGAAAFAAAAAGIYPSWQLAVERMVQAGESYTPR